MAELKLSELPTMGKGNIWELDVLGKEANSVKSDSRAELGFEMTAEELEVG